MSGAEIAKLPDPELFRDAHFLSTHGRWSPQDLEDTDALLLEVIRMFQTPVRRG